MSKHRYCPKCGKENPISNNFCGGCASSLSSINSKASNPSPSIKNNIQTFQPFSPDVDDEDDMYIDRLEHLHVNIDHLEMEPIFVNNKKETIGSLQANPIHPSEIQKRDGQYTNVDKEQFIKEFQKETSNASPQESK